MTGLAASRNWIRSFDRPGFRWFLGAAYTVAGRMSSHGVARVFYDRGWVHRVGRDWLVEARPRRRAPELSETWLREYCGQLYSPCPGDTVMDVGAGYGWEMLHFARAVGKGGRVIAIEAHPLLAQMMKRTVELNGLAQVTPLNCAVADRSQVLFIEDDLADHIGNAVSRDGVGQKIEIQARSIDELYDELKLDGIDFLKMNIEGAEQYAIEGMTKAIKRTRVVAVSCHDFKADRTGDNSFRTKAKIEDFLRREGFVIAPRTSSLPWLRDQVNAYNPALVRR